MTTAVGAGVAAAADGAADVVLAEVAAALAAEVGEEDTCVAELVAAWLVAEPALLGAAEDVTAELGAADVATELEAVALVVAVTLPPQAASRGSAAPAPSKDSTRRRERDCGEGARGSEKRARVIG